MEDLTKEEQDFLKNLLELSSRDSQLKFLEDNKEQVTDNVWNYFPDWLKLSTGIFGLSRPTKELREEQEIELNWNGSPKEKDESLKNKKLCENIYENLQLGVLYTYSQIQELTIKAYQESEMDIPKKPLLGLADFFDIQRGRKRYIFKTRKIL